MSNMSSSEGLTFHLLPEDYDLDIKGEVGSVGGDAKWDWKTAFRRIAIGGPITITPEESRNVQNTTQTKRVT